MADTNGFTRLPDGSLIMRRPQPVQSKPGLLAGLLQRLMPQKPVDKYWLPETPVAAREAPTNAVPIPAAPTPVAAPSALPAYNSQAAQWGEIEAQAAKEQAIADQLKGVSKNVMNSKALIEGKW